MKPTLNPRPGESTAAAITRLYRHIRRLDRSYKPGSQFAARVQHKQATSHPRLRLVK